MSAWVLAGFLFIAFSLGEVKFPWYGAGGYGKLYGHSDLWHGSSWLFVFSSPEAVDETNSKMYFIRVRSALLYQTQEGAGWIQCWKAIKYLERAALAWDGCHQGQQSKPCWRQDSFWGAAKVCWSWFGRDVPSCGAAAAVLQSRLQKCTHTKHWWKEQSAGAGAQLCAQPATMAQRYESSRYVTYR